VTKMKNWKKASAAILAAGLITTSASQVWANETEKVDSPDLETVTIQDALENLKEDNVSAKDLEVITSIVPTGYTANNIFALSKNLEKVSNPNAKAALQKNIDKALAKWESNNPEVEVPEVPEVPETPEVEVPETETPDAEVPEVEIPDTETPDVEDASATDEETDAADEKKLTGLENAAKNIEKNAGKTEAVQLKVEQKKATAAEKSGKAKKIKNN
jgi:hypothetical protein